MVQKIVDPNFQIQTFNVSFDGQLSPIAITLLKSFNYKLYYYVIDDIFYLLKSNPNERDYLMRTLHSSVIFLQNNLHVNFFDIYVYEINIHDISKFNRFLTQEKKSDQNSTKITIKLAYQIKSISKKLETIW
jgi:hypothetical protein